jgi:hypothetical protein
MSESAKIGALQARGYTSAANGSSARKTRQSPARTNPSQQPDEKKRVKREKEAQRRHEKALELETLQAELESSRAVSARYLARIHVLERDNDQLHEDRACMELHDFAIDFTEAEDDKWNDARLVQLYEYVAASDALVRHALHHKNMEMYRECVETFFVSYVKDTTLRGTQRERASDKQRKVSDKHQLFMYMFWLCTGSPYWQLSLQFGVPLRYLHKVLHRCVVPRARTSRSRFLRMGFLIGHLKRRQHRSRRGWRTSSGQDVSLCARVSSRQVGRQGSASL